MYDYYYAYQKGGLNLFSICKNSWLHLSNCDTTVPYGYEWTMSRCGLNVSSYIAWRVNSNGNPVGISINDELAIRPVFFLTSSINYVSGSGKSDDPFIIS